MHAEDNGCVLRYEESGAHEEDNQAHLSQVANNFLEGYTSGLCEVPKVILETDGLKTDVEKSAPISEVCSTIFYSFELWFFDSTLYEIKALL